MFLYSNSLKFKQNANLRASLLGIVQVAPILQIQWLCQFLILPFSLPFSLNVTIETFMALIVTMETLCKLEIIGCKRYAWHMQAYLCIWMLQTSLVF